MRKTLHAATHTASTNKILKTTAAKEKRRVEQLHTTQPVKSASYSLVSTSMRISVQLKVNPATYSSMHMVSPVTLTSVLLHIATCHITYYVTPSVQLRVLYSRAKKQ